MRKNGSAAIREFTDLGSGIKIAMRDLEIRGAGNLLGAEQHGHMEAVGYDLYCKMLGEAVRQEKGELDEDIFTTTMDLIWMRISRTVIFQMNIRNWIFTSGSPELRMKKRWTICWKS